MSEIPGIFASFAAGLLSFLSPCVLPLLPSYLAMLAGTSVKDLRITTAGSTASSSDSDEMAHLGSVRKSALRSSIAFTLGFSAVFIILGIVLSSASSMLSGAGKMWSNIAGIIVIVLGLNVAFDFLKILNIEKRMHFTQKPVGLFQATLFGAAFAAGWSPCVGPILASILLLAGRASILQAGILLASYSLGLALPFILAGAFFGRLEGYFNLLKKHMRLIKYLSGLLLVAVGASMLFSDLRSLSASFSRFGYMLSELSSGGMLIARISASLIYAFLAFLFIRSYRVKTVAKKRIASLAGIIFFSVLLLLEAAGLISSVRMISGWLLFQGV